MLRKGKISKTLNFRGKVNVATDRLKFLKSHERWLGTKQGPEYDPHKNIMAQTGPAHKKLSQGLLDRAMSKRKSGIAVGLRILSLGAKGPRAMGKLIKLKRIRKLKGKNKF
ncbi:MAG TPA: hypothetical protein VJG83_03055 [archaeon]|nr:hypothetical protein [archaeon]